METAATIVERWDLTYRHAAGPIVTEFYRRLRDEGRLAGRRCPACRRVLVPPRAFCDRCYRDTEEWVNVGSTGTVEAFTIVYQQFQNLPAPPYAVAYVRLGGADTAILNYVRGVDLADSRRAAHQLRIGTPVRVRLADAREGRITDFWFEAEAR